MQAPFVLNPLSQHAFHEITLAHAVLADIKPPRAKGAHEGVQDQASRHERVDALRRRLERQVRERVGVGAAQVQYRTNLGGRHRFGADDFARYLRAHLRRRAHAAANAVHDVRAVRVAVGQRGQPLEEGARHGVHLLGRGQDGAYERGIGGERALAQAHVVEVAPVLYAGELRGAAADVHQRAALDRAVAGSAYEAKVRLVGCRQQVDGQPALVFPGRAAYKWRTTLPPT